MFDKKIKPITKVKFLVKITKATTKTFNLLREETVEDGPYLK
jgi:hypothetical protein